MATVFIRDSGSFLEFISHKLVSSKEVFSEAQLYGWVFELSFNLLAQEQSQTAQYPANLALS